MEVVTGQAIVTSYLGSVAVDAILPFDGSKIAGEGHGIAVLVGLRICVLGIQIVASEAAFLVKQAKMYGVVEGRERPLAKHRALGLPIDGEGAPCTGVVQIDAVTLAAKTRRFGVD